MRLTVKVKEGDWAAFEGPYGNLPAYYAARFSKSAGTSGIAAAEGGDPLRRWRELDAMNPSFEVSVPESATIAELERVCLADAYRAGLVNRSDIGPVCATWLATSGTVLSRRLDGALRVTDSGLADEDLLILCVERVSGNGYMLGPAPNPAVLLERLQLTMSTVPPGLYRLWGVLLYTSVDFELATYVRTNFDDLHALSGPHTQIFVIERFAPWSEAKYWRQGLDPGVRRQFSAMRWLHWQPYDPQGAYEIAAHLGVDAQHLPCLVLFHALDKGPGGPEKIVFHIEETSPRYFRALFGGIAQVLRTEGILPPDADRRERDDWSYDTYTEDPEEHWRSRSSPAPRVLASMQIKPQPQSDPVKLRAKLGGREHPPKAVDAFDRIRAAELAIKASLRPATEAPPKGVQLTDCRVTLITGESMSENFYFHGVNTTFINRPADTVIQDFQNNHQSTPAGEDLRRVLELILSSRDLPDTDRESAAQDVHALAISASTPNPSQESVRPRLERLHATLTRAADIAQPALALIATITATLTS
ncbi:hypothetical protein ACFWOG_20420 [Kitasatospora sp. NPDC058406]|uniref:hypothetical protein n=1 Tax=Kitasatospora sp. NPDC058406 TaxID=3346483 RepID=UPI00366971FE